MDDPVAFTKKTAKQLVDQVRKNISQPLESHAQRGDHQPDTPYPAKVDGDVAAGTMGAAIRQVTTNGTTWTDADEGSLPVYFFGAASDGDSVDVDRDLSNGSLYAVSPEGNANNTGDSKICKLLKLLKANLDPDTIVIPDDPETGEDEEQNTLQYILQMQEECGCLSFVSCSTCIDDKMPSVLCVTVSGWILHNPVSAGLASAFAAFVNAKHEITMLDTECYGEISQTTSAAGQDYEYGIRLSHTNVPAAGWVVNVFIRVVGNTAPGVAISGGNLLGGDCTASASGSEANTDYNGPKPTAIGPMMATAWSGPLVADTLDYTVAVALP